MDCVRLQSFAPSRRPCLIDIFKHEASTAVAQSEHNVYIHNYNIFSYGMKMTEKKNKNYAHAQQRTFSMRSLW